MSERNAVDGDNGRMGIFDVRDRVGMTGWERLCFRRLDRALGCTVPWEFVDGVLQGHSTDFTPFRPHREQNSCGGDVQANRR